MQEKLSRRPSTSFQQVKRYWHQQRLLSLLKGAATCGYNILPATPVCLASRHWVGWELPLLHWGCLSWRSPGRFVSLLLLFWRQPGQAFPLSASCLLHLGAVVGVSAALQFCSLVQRDRASLLPLLFCCCSFPFPLDKTKAESHHEILCHCLLCCQKPQSCHCIKFLIVPHSKPANSSCIFYKDMPGNHGGISLIFPRPKLVSLGNFLNTANNIRRPWTASLPKRSYP